MISETHPWRPSGGNYPWATEQGSFLCFCVESLWLIQSNAEKIGLADSSFGAALLDELRSEHERGVIAALLRWEDADETIPVKARRMHFDWQRVARAEDVVRGWNSAGFAIGFARALK